MHIKCGVSHNKTALITSDYGQIRCPTCRAPFCLNDVIPLVEAEPPLPTAQDMDANAPGSALAAKGSGQAAETQAKGSAALHSSAAESAEAGATEQPEPEAQAGLRAGPSELAGGSAAGRPVCTYWRDKGRCKVFPLPFLEPLSLPFPPPFHCRVHCLCLQYGADCRGDHSGPTLAVNLVGHPHPVGPDAARYARARLSPAR